MPYQMILGDITKIPADAIVTAANQWLKGGGGVDGAVHRAAGPELLAECRTLGGCPTGQAKLTGAYKLPAKYVIHAVGPVWQGGEHDEAKLLASCYRSALELAKEQHCESISFPLISSGAYGFPHRDALRIALQTISDYLAEDNHEMMVNVVLYNRPEPEMDLRRMSVMRHYENANLMRDDDRAVREAVLSNVMGSVSSAFNASQPMADADLWDAEAADTYIGAKPSMSLADRIKKQDAGFAQTLIRLIDERGMKDSDCYNRANISRQVFSKIRTVKDYHPKKETVAALAVALKLNLAETQDLMRRAGYALSNVTKFDIIVSYYIASKNYNINEINICLLEYDQPLLGNVEK